MQNYATFQGPINNPFIPLSRVETRRRKSAEEMKELNSGGGVAYIVITCEEDIHLVTDVLRSKLGVFSTEFVLGAVTRCEMDFDLSRYLTTT